MFVVGLTGGIGSGKTAVSDYFHKLGVDVVDADVVARIVVNPGTPALKKIAQHFGNDLLLSDGSLNRAALRQKVFADPTEKAWLENLLHPLIGQEIDNQLANASSPYVIYVSPLLLESQQNYRCHHILVVDAPVELQVERATARDNNTESMIRRIVKQQMPRAERLQQADDILVNDGDLESLYAKIDRLHQKFLRLPK
jgi:dephospho-CoA kinase